MGSPQEVGGAQEALTADRRPTVALDRLKGVARARWTTRRAALSVITRTDEDRMLVELGNEEGRLALHRSPEGTLRSAWGPRMEIPVSGSARRTPQELALAFVSEYADLFLVNTGALTPTSTQEKRDGRGHVHRFTQVESGHPVFESHLLLHTKADHVTWILAHLTPSSGLPAPTPTLSAADVAATLADADPATAVLGYFDPQHFGLPSGAVHLAWRIRAINNERTIYVDATSGVEIHEALTNRHDSPDPHQEIFHCEGCDEAGLPGVLQYDDVCHVLPPYGVNYCQSPAQQCYADSSPSGSHCESPVFKGTSGQLSANTATMEDYLYDRHGRIGWDNWASTQRSMRASSDVDDTERGEYTVDPTCRAYWDATRMQVVTGSRRFGLDVVAHEFAHGIDQVEGQIGGSLCAPSSGISEGLSDALGEFVEGYATGSADWVHGTGSPTCTAPVRNSSLSNPGSASAYCYNVNFTMGGLLGCGISVAPELLPQPDSYANYRDDCGGWWNSTIVGKAAYLMARDPAAGWITHNGVFLGGIGAELASEVMYDVMTARLANPAVDFTDFRNAVHAECLESGGSNFISCMRAADAVGIWSGDTDTGWNVPNNISFAVDYSSGFHDTWAFYTVGGCHMYRKYSCIFGNCSWSSETVYQCAYSNLPDSNLTVTMAPASHSVDKMQLCWRTRWDSIWCDTKTSTGWSWGPDIGYPTGLDGDPITAYHDGKFHILYQTSDRRIWHASRSVSSSTWAVPYDTGIETYGNFDIATSDEDYYSDSNLNEMWMVYRGPAQEIRLARWDGFLLNSWSEKGIFEERRGKAISCPTYSNDRWNIHRPITTEPVQIDFFRGRLQLVANDIDGATDTTWAATCDMPCTFTQCTETVNIPGGGTCCLSSAEGSWTRLVQQDGNGRRAASLDNYGRNTGRLHLFHHTDSSNDLYERSRMSE